jgi:SARP family transcriptional regulator, regulator of embCAB operon
MLGPLRVSNGENSSFISAQKVETLLAVLLIRSDQVVTTSQLMNEIWGEDVPRRAMAGIHVYISQIRKFLSCLGKLEDPIVTRPPGYMLRLGSDELDFHSFLNQVSLGRQHSRLGRYEQAVACFEDALSLWRGPVLGEIHYSPILSGFATRLTETRVECHEILIDAELMLGRHRELIGRLYSVSADYPLHEAFYRQLMLALYRSDRQADALNVYQSARTVLNDELGLEPCRALQEIHQSILTADPSLDLRGTWLAVGPDQKGRPGRKGGPDQSKSELALSRMS